MLKRLHCFITGHNFVRFDTNITVVYSLHCGHVCTRCNMYTCTLNDIRAALSTAYQAGVDDTDRLFSVALGRNGMMPEFLRVCAKGWSDFIYRMSLRGYYPAEL